MFDRIKGHEPGFRVFTNATTTPQRAALAALTQLENLQNLASISQDGFAKSYDVVGALQQRDRAKFWGKDFEKIAGRYQRVVV